MTTEKPPQIKAGPPFFLIKAPGWYSHIWRHVGAVEGWLRPLRFDLRWLKRWRNPGPDLASAARTWRDAPRNSPANLQLYSVWTTRETGERRSRDQLSHLQHQPQLVAALHVLLVEHPVELDDVGVVGQSFQDVVLRLDLLIDVLENTRVRVAALRYANIDGS